MLALEFVNRVEAERPTTKQVFRSLLKFVVKHHADFIGASNNLLLRPSENIAYILNKLGLSIVQIPKHKQVFPKDLKGLMQSCKPLSATAIPFHRVVWKNSQVSGLRTVKLCFYF